VSLLTAQTSDKYRLRLRPGRTAYSGTGAAWAGHAARWDLRVDCLQAERNKVVHLAGGGLCGAMLYLCSEDGRYVTGITLPVDAGLVAR